MSIRTESRKDLNEWVEEDPDARTDTALGLACGVSRVTVSGWRLGRFRPDHDHRDVLEIVTEGRVRADGWKLARERQGLASVRPFRATGSKRIHRRKSLAATGTDGR